MGNKAILVICLIAVLAPVYALFSGAQAKNMKDNGVTRKDTHLSKGMSYGMCLGIVVGAILGFAIWHTGSALCMGVFAGDCLGALIGILIGSAKDKAENRENAEDF